MKGEVTDDDADGDASSSVELVESIGSDSSLLELLNRVACAFPKMTRMITAVAPIAASASTLIKRGKQNTHTDTHIKMKKLVKLSIAAP
jgi:hypothetical protein